MASSTIVSGVAWSWSGFTGAAWGGFAEPQPVTVASLPPAQIAASSAPAIWIICEFEAALSCSRATSHSWVTGL